VTEDEKSIALQQLANVVIDAYLNRDKQFVPKCRPGGKVIMYLRRPDGDRDHPGLRTNVIYRCSDYESPVPSEQQKARPRSQK
jgi:hypothetical protein